MLKILLAAMISLSLITACGRSNNQTPSPTVTDNANDTTGNNKTNNNMADDMGNAVNDVENGVGDAVKGAGNAVKNTGEAIKDMNTGK